MNRTPRLVGGVTVALLVPFLLAGCGATDNFASLPAAQLPEAVIDSAGPAIENSVRELGQDADQRSYYVGTWETDGHNQTCLVMVVADGDYARGCAEQLSVTLTFDTAKATLHPEPVDAESGTDATVLGRFLIVQY